MILIQHKAACSYQHSLKPYVSAIDTVQPVCAIKKEQSRTCVSTQYKTEAVINTVESGRHIYIYICYHHSAKPHVLLTLCKAAGVINRMRNRRCYQHNAKPYVLLTLQSCAVKLLVELMFTRMPGELPQAIHGGEEIWVTYRRTQNVLNMDRLSKTLSFGYCK